MIAALLLQRMSSKRRIKAEPRLESGGKSDINVYGSACCRTCLGSDDLVSIFRTSDDDKMSYNLKLLTGLEIKRNDGLSQKICKKCFQIANLAIQFRRKSKIAEKALRRMLIRKHVKKYSIEEDIKPNISRISKTETEREEFDYDDVPFDDDFQNDDEFNSKEDVKPIYVKKEPKDHHPVKPVRQRGITIPSGPPYTCNICNKEFRMKATYSAHLRFHTNYCVCESCGKRCRNNNQLQEHKRARHGLGKIHKCAYCEYSSATKEALVIHERRHTGERPYICDHCGATFHRRSNLVQHIAIHLPDKNFQCTFCPRREKSKKRLQIHVSKAHREKRYSYKCPRCLKLFQRNEHVHRHLARVHRVPRPDHPHIERVLAHHQDRHTYKPTPPPHDYVPQLLAGAHVATV